MSWECTVFTTGVTSAVCATSAGGAQANFPGQETATISGTDVAFFPVTVTAGADQLAAETGTSGSGSSGVSSSPAKATANSASTAAVRMGLAGLAAVAMAL